MPEERKIYKQFVDIFRPVYIESIDLSTSPHHYQLPFRLLSLIIGNKVKVNPARYFIPRVIGQVPHRRPESRVQRFDEMPRDREDLDGAVQTKLVKGDVWTVCSVTAPGVGVNSGTSQTTQNQGNSSLRRCRN